MSFELRYGSLCTYSPRGTTDISKKSQTLRDRIKAGDIDTLNRVAEKIAQQQPGTGILAEFFSSSCILVPVPRSSLAVAKALWPALKIAEALRNQGLGREIHPYLKRASPIPKSAYQAPGERPDIKTHVDSLTVEGASLLADEITLVDDFITKGTTLCACAIRLKREFPNCTIKGFAVVRTMGLVPEVRALVEPCAGTIVCDGNNVRRTHNHYE